MKVIDPTHNEEVVMAERMVATINANGDICAIQKAGEGVSRSVIMQCLQLATTKAAGITKQIKQAVEAYNSERALQKIKRETTCVGINVEENQNQSVDSKGISDFPSHAAKAHKQGHAHFRLSCSARAPTTFLDHARQPKSCLLGQLS